ncbi:unnamed protein product [Orchesella dallaii]|uniref:Transmembrane protein n=1 Tax=Orchesella dallaii TaxID=48710 RepID=A0ABP1PZU0_9HEXA
MACSCCMLSQNGVKILAIIDAVLGFVNLGLFALCIKYLPNYYEGWTWSESENDWIEDEKISANDFIIPIIITIFQILLAFMLHYVAIHRDYRNCRIWIMVKAIVVVLHTASLLYIWNDELLDNFSLGITAFPLCYKIFEIFEVFLFLRILNKENQTDNGIIYSTVPTSTAPPPPPSDLAEQQPCATSDFPQSQYASCDQENIYYPLQQPGPVVPPEQVNYPVITEKYPVISENAYFA